MDKMTKDKAIIHNTLGLIKEKNQRYNHNNRL